MHSAGERNSQLPILVMWAPPGKHLFCCRQEEVPFQHSLAVKCGAIPGGGYAGNQESASFHFLEEIIETNERTHSVPKICNGFSTAGLLPASKVVASCTKAHEPF